MLTVYILAAGKGTRMRSDLPKVLHPIAGKPMLHHVLDTSRTLNPSRTCVVVGHGAEKVKASCTIKTLQYIEQSEQLGTGHAVQMGLPHIPDNGPVLILYGDVPLIEASTLSELVAQAGLDKLALLTVGLVDPTGYGRVLRNNRGKVVRIVEQKDASAAELAIPEVNTGIMVVQGQHLHQWLPQLKNNNAQQEYYLTDLIAMAVADGVEIVTGQPRNWQEVLGVNDRLQQAKLERYTQLRTAHTLMAKGLSLSDPERFDCRGELQIGLDCAVDVNCIFEGAVSLGDRVRIGANCIIRDAKIADDTVIEPNSLIDQAEVGPGCHIGPFARLRPGTVLQADAKIGNFVETKKAVIGVGSKVNHLSYVGDAHLGKGVNVGAGTITCNYDGVAKHQTTIGDDVFVGSNTALVAPVTVADGATIAAGSTITSNVQSKQLAVARQKQRNIDHWVRPSKK